MDSTLCNSQICISALMYAVAKQTLSGHSKSVASAIKKFASYGYVSLYLQYGISNSDISSEPDCVAVLQHDHILYQTT